MPKQDENLSMLHDAFDNLAIASDGSLRAAHAFGQIADALHAIGYSFATMGAEVNRTGATVYAYARLYRKYVHIDRLLELAHELGTYDISILVRDEGSLRTKYGYQCGICQSWSTHRRPLPEGGIPREPVPAVFVSASS